MSREWNAKWIGMESEDISNPVFFKDFYLDDQVTKATLFIASTSLFEAYVNGQRVSDEYLTPYPCCEENCLQYFTYDVTDLLYFGPESEANSIDVFLGNGWNKELPPALRAELEVEVLRVPLQENDEDPLENDFMDDELLDDEFLDEADFELISYGEGAGEEEPVRETIQLLAMKGSKKTGTVTPFELDDLNALDDFLAGVIEAPSEPQDKARAAQQSRARTMSQDKVRSAQQGKTKTTPVRRQAPSKRRRPAFFTMETSAPSKTERKKEAELNIPLRKVKPQPAAVLEEDDSELEIFDFEDWDENVSVQEERKEEPAESVKDVVKQEAEPEEPSEEEAEPEEAEPEEPTEEEAEPEEAEPEEPTEEEAEPEEAEPEEPSEEEAEPEEAESEEPSEEDAEPEETEEPTEEEAEAAAEPIRKPKLSMPPILNVEPYGITDEALEDIFSAPETEKTSSEESTEKAEEADNDLEDEDSQESVQAELEEENNTEADDGILELTEEMMEELELTEEDAESPVDEIPEDSFPDLDLQLEEQLKELVGETTENADQKIEIQLEELTDEVLGDMEMEDDTVSEYYSGPVLTTEAEGTAEEEVLSEEGPEEIALMDNRGKKRTEPQNLEMLLDSFVLDDDLENAAELEALLSEIELESAGKRGKAAAVKGENPEAEELVSQIAEEPLQADEDVTGTGDEFLSEEEEGIEQIINSFEPIEPAISEEEISEDVDALVQGFDVNQIMDIRDTPEVELEDTAVIPVEEIRDAAGIPEEENESGAEVPVEDMAVTKVIPAEEIRDAAGIPEEENESEAEVPVDDMAVTMVIPVEEIRQAAGISADEQTEYETEISDDADGIDAVILPEEPEEAVILIGTDETWKYYASDIEYSDIEGGEIFNRILWEEKDNPEKDAVLIDPELSLVERYSLPVLIKEQIPVKEVLYAAEGNPVLDFGYCFSGFVSFKAALSKGTKVTLIYAEDLTDDSFDETQPRFTYVSDGVPEVAAPHFTCFTGRYVKVEGWEGELIPDDFTGCVLYSDMDRTGYLETSEIILNQKAEDLLWLQKRASVVMPKDAAPEDVCAFAPAASYNMDTRKFLNVYLKDLRLQPAGDQWGAAARCIWGLYQMYGDENILENDYDAIKEWICGIDARDAQRKDKQYLYNFDLDDEEWISMDDETEIAYIASACYYEAARIMAEAAAVLDNEKDAFYFRRLSGKIKQAFLDEYFTNAGRLAIDTQSAYILALQFGLYVDKERLKNALRVRIRKDGGKMKCCSQAAPYFGIVLAENDMIDLAYDTLLSETESFSNDVEFMYAYMAGIRPITPGFRETLLAPVPDGRIRFCKCRYVSPAGEIVSDWSLDDSGALSFHFEVPEGMTARIALPYYPVCAAGGNEVMVRHGSYDYSYMPGKHLLP